MEQIIHRFRSRIREVTFPAISLPEDHALLAGLYQLGHSEWWPAAAIEQEQRRQLLALLGHAATHVPRYRKILSNGRLPSVEDADAFDEFWLSLPVLTRSALQSDFDKLKASQLPATHGKRYIAQSSGSTGRPVRVLHTDLTRFFWRVMTLRDNLWQRMDFMQPLLSVRPDMAVKDRERAENDTWGTPVSRLFHSCPSLMVSSRVDIDRQLDWIEEFSPVYLHAMPSILRALVLRSLERGIDLDRLALVKSFGEPVTDDLRALVKEHWQVRIADIYSSQEVGYMALQCPDHDHYHIMAETMYIEVLDEDGRTCKPGETGRLVVTPLHNFATPLIRYEVGDYAEVGEPCPCGRGLPVLNRIHGRTRNMLKAPDGCWTYPSFPVELWQSVGDIRQFQLRQTALDQIEVSLVTPGLDAGAEKLLIAKLQDRLGYPFAIHLHYVDDIPRQKNGKFEDFISVIQV